MIFGSIQVLLGVSTGLLSVAETRRVRKKERQVQDDDARDERASQIYRSSTRHPRRASRNIEIRFLQVIQANEILLRGSDPRTAEILTLNHGYWRCLLSRTPLCYV